jgi:hypothetical protein
MSNNNFKFVYDTDEKNTKKNKEKLSSSKKIKFFDSNKRDQETLNNAKCTNTNSNNRVDDESFLLLPRMNSKHKTKVELKDKMHPTDYDIELKSNNIQKTTQSTTYYGDHYGPGKGFGNIDKINDIRNGNFTRLENDNFFKDRESSINDRRHILFKDYQNPQNIILPFPRGGEITRKSFNSGKDESKIEDFTFKY